LVFECVCVWLRVCVCVFNALVAREDF
jgi:hypothetical protein